MKRISYRPISGEIGCECGFVGSSDESVIYMQRFITDVRVVRSLQIKDKYEAIFDRKDGAERNSVINIVGLVSD